MTLRRIEPPACGSPGTACPARGTAARILSQIRHRRSSHWRRPIRGLARPDRSPSCAQPASYSAGAAWPGPPGPMPARQLAIAGSGRAALQQARVNRAVEAEECFEQEAGAPDELVRGGHSIPLAVAAAAHEPQICVAGSQARWQGTTPIGRICMLVRVAPANRCGHTVASSTRWVRASRLSRRGHARGSTAGRRAAAPGGSRPAPLPGRGRCTAQRRRRRRRNSRRLRAARWLGRR